ncbi:MAG: GreA/GreB family elongation factor [Candidatus Pacebacteria bacterium]|nr:GreA/GreB family elongation factor [Candidatus Paceibacterota bacterium]
MNVNKVYYLTEQGLSKLKQELEQLKELRKTKLGKEAPSAFYSEELNSEFVSFRDDMDALDAKLEEMEYILNNYEIIKPPAVSGRDKVNLGAKVRVEINGEIDEFVMVGTWEANPALGMISNESPVGMALMGKKAGETALVNSSVKIEYKIKKITY